MESNMFGKIDTLYLEKIEYYIGILRKRGKDDSVAFMLNKMLASLFTVRGSWTNTLVSVSYALLSENRDLLRNGWYVMGYYWFGRNFENAIRCYRIGLSYGSTSPLWDAVIDELAGVAFNDSYIPEENKIGQKHTWHLDIPHPYPYTEDDIIHLYSSERLLSLKLEHWTSEGETNAPAYYLAYNMACAYSRLTKATEALSWLRVSFRLNPALKKLVQTDKDLLFLRENHRKELDLILK